MKKSINIYSCTCTCIDTDVVLQLYMCGQEYSYKMMPLIMSGAHLLSQVLHHVSVCSRPHYQDHLTAGAVLYTVVLLCVGILTCFRVKSGCSLLLEETCPVPVPHEDPGLLGPEALPSSDVNSRLLWSLRNSSSIRAANFSETTQCIVLCVSI